MFKNLVKFFLLPLIRCHVLHVFHRAITCSVCTPKVCTPSGPSDFRPISIVSVLSRAFERILHDHVLEHVHGHNLLSDFQSGFRRGHMHSTTTALFRVTDDLRSVKAESQTIFILHHQGLAQFNLDLVDDMYFIFG
jgi:hypothetical protein